MQNEITSHLFSLQDTAYRDFQKKLIPDISEDYIIGVRVPELRSYAKAIFKTPAAEEFLSSLPHTYYDENCLHSLLISLEKDHDRCVSLLDAFLPYVDNWATCDIISPKAFKNKGEMLLTAVDRWISSSHLYTVRFAIGVLMSHFLEENFSLKHMEIVADMRSDEYYLNMMRAWYFATALAKQYEYAVTFLEQGRLDQWTHNKTIQKAVESYRITDEKKTYLRTLRK